MQSRIEIVLPILSLLAFAVSFFGSLNVALSLTEEWRLIAILEANPNRHLDYIREAFLYLILPSVVGLVFGIITFVREMKSPTRILHEWWLLLTALGGLFFFRGFIGLWTTYTSYGYVTQLIDLWNCVDIADFILTVYATAWVGFILWIFPRTLFMLSPVFKISTTGKKDLSPPQKLRFSFLDG